MTDGVLGGGVGGKRDRFGTGGFLEDLQREHPVSALSAQSAFNHRIERGLTHLGKFTDNHGSKYIINLSSKIINLF